MNQTQDLNVYTIQREHAKIGKAIYELGNQVDGNIFERNEYALDKLDASWIGWNQTHICVMLYLSGEYDV